MKTKKRAFGDIGEKLAARYLRQHHYRIIARNVRAPHGELDIVAENRQFLVFCEVRTRSPKSITFTDAAGTVDAKKQMHLISAAWHYLHQKPTKKRVRFDIITVCLSPSERRLHLPFAIAPAYTSDIHHIEDAFMMKKSHI